MTSLEDHASTCYGNETENEPLPAVSSITTGNNLSKRRKLGMRNRGSPASTSKVSLKDEEVNPRNPRIIIQDDDIVPAERVGRNTRNKKADTVENFSDDDLEKMVC